jgi:hypothetical protein
VLVDANKSVRRIEPYADYAALGFLGIGNPIDQTRNGGELIGEGSKIMAGATDIDSVHRDSIA